MAKIIFICTFIILSNCQISFSQNTNNYRWLNPVASSFPVIEGRGWQTALAHPYDRLPSKAEKMVRPAVWGLSQNSAGEYINFKTSATTIIVRYIVRGGYAMPHMPATGVSGVDLYAKDASGAWKWAAGSYSFGDTCEYHFTNLSLSAKQENFRLYLPLYNSVSWMSIGISSNAEFSFLPVSNKQPLVLYGTSIMQGACASRPGLARTNILGRKLNQPVINLGFSGNGQLEQPLIDLMNETNASVFVLDCLPNLHDRNKFPDTEIEKRIINSVKSLQQNHPQTPIILTEHASGVADIDLDSAWTNKYLRVNNILIKVFSKMQQENIKHIYLLTAKDIGFTNESLVDDAHPSDIGMMQYANAYEKIIRQILKLPTGRKEYVGQSIQKSIYIKQKNT